MSFVAKIWRVVKPVLLNKYLIVFLTFVIFVTFFDQHNLIQRWQTHMKIRELQKEYDYYQNEIKANKQKMDQLKTSDEYLEKIAREQYHMKSKDEDIYIIKETPKKK